MFKPGTFFVCGKRRLPQRLKSGLPPAYPIHPAWESGLSGSFHITRLSDYRNPAQGRRHDIPEQVHHRFLRRIENIRQAQTGSTAHRVELTRKSPSPAVPETESRLTEMKAENLETGISVTWHTPFRVSPIIIEQVDDNKDRYNVQLRERSVSDS